MILVGVQHSTGIIFLLSWDTDCHASVSTGSQ
nr:MAG TPA: hypothetical protein [Caudoviricetes sp.]